MSAAPLPAPDGAPVSASAPARRRWSWAAAPLTLALLAGLVTLVWELRRDAGVARLQAEGAARLAGEAGSLERLFDKHRHLPRLLALDPRLAAALAGGARQAEAVDTANRHLAAVSHLVDLQAAYLMDRGGRVLAASNWDTPESFVGWNYTFRPYFQDALATGAGVLYAVGATTEAPGLFMSQALRTADGALAGVVVVKISLAAIEAGWRDEAGVLALADARGVLFLASRDDWRYRTMAPLAASERRVLADARQYGRQALQPLPALQPLVAGWRGEAARAEAWSAHDAAGQRLLLARRLEPWGWTLVLEQDLAVVRRAAAVEAGAAGLLAGLLLAAWGLWRLQRQRLAERRDAARALQAAQAGLEARLAERTAALTEANRALQQRVQTLHETERILQATQDRAVQAGKLAVLGQLAAGVTHELNQPLAALATCAGNAVKQLDRGRDQDLRETLRLMQELAGRLGALVAQLKGFARPGGAAVAPVAVADALDMARLMLAQRLRQSGATLDIDLAQDAHQVRADRTRLEQVLVNLLRNALDASLPAEGTPPSPPRIEVRGRREADGRVALRVRDHGPGLSEAARDHLFEPFFTTRARSEGLGLGLAISRAIAQGLGGELTGANMPPAEGGGAAFTLVLPAA